MIDRLVADRLRYLGTRGAIVSSSATILSPASKMRSDLSTTDHPFLEHDDFSFRIVIPPYLFDLRMISAQTRSAFVARENRYPLFRIML